MDTRCYLKEKQIVAEVDSCPENATNIYYISGTINLNT